MKTLLIIEDQVDLLNNNRRFFTSRGYKVQAAENLRQARRFLSEDAPDAIVLDIMLPDGSGLDFINELRYGGVGTPVILLTAMNKPANITDGFKKAPTITCPNLSTTTFCWRAWRR